MKRLLFLFYLLKVSDVSAVDNDEGTWNGGFYEMIFGPKATVTAESLNSTRERTQGEENMSSVLSVLQSFLKLVQSKSPMEELVVHANPLWDEDTANFSSKGLDGVLVKSEPVHACQKVDPHPDYPTFEELEIEEVDSNTTRFKTKWILIVDETKCDIGVKMANAQQQGYSAMLMLSSNPTANEDLSKISNRNIFTAKIAIEDGLNLIETYAYPEPVAVKLQDLRPQQWSYAKYRILMILLGILIFVISIGGILFQVYKMCKRLYFIKEAEEKMEHLIRAVEHLPVAIWMPNPVTVTVTQAETCRSCYGIFVAKDVLLILHCSHQFHKRCVLGRLKTGKTDCPVCHESIMDQDSAEMKEELNEKTPLLKAAAKRCKSIFSKRPVIDEPKDTEDLISTPVSTGTKDEN